MQLEASTQRTMAELSDTASKAQDRLVSTSADLGGCGDGYLHRWGGQLRRNIPEATLRYRRLRQFQTAALD